MQSEPLRTRAVRFRLRRYYSNRSRVPRIIDISIRSGALVIGTGVDRFTGGCVSKEERERERERDKVRCRAVSIEARSIADAR